MGWDWTSSSVTALWHDTSWCVAPSLLTPFQQFGTTSFCSTKKQRHYFLPFSLLHVCFPRNLFNPNGEYIALKCNYVSLLPVCNVFFVCFFLILQCIHTAKFSCFLFPTDVSLVPYAQPSFSPGNVKQRISSITSVLCILIWFRKVHFMLRVFDVRRYRGTWVVLYFITVQTCPCAQACLGQISMQVAFFRFLNHKHDI